MLKKKVNVKIHTISSAPRFLSRVGVPNPALPLNSSAEVESSERVCVLEHIKCTPVLPRGHSGRTYHHHSQSKQRERARSRKYGRVVPPIYLLSLFILFFLYIDVWDKGMCFKRDLFSSKWNIMIMREGFGVDGWWFGLMWFCKLKAEK